MTRLVAFLGSINVGGNRIKMDQLRAALTARGLRDVGTVVASGNVLFDPGGRDISSSEALIAEVLERDFGIASLVTVRDRGGVLDGVEANPFHGVGEDKFVHSHFLDGQPTAEQFETLLTDHAGRGDEKMALGDRVLFIDYGTGVADTKLTGPFMERRLGCRGTARNMRSLKRILEKMD